MIAGLVWLQGWYGCRVGMIAGVAVVMFIPELSNTGACVRARTHTHTHTHITIGE